MVLGYHISFKQYTRQIFLSLSKQYKDHLSLHILKDSIFNTMFNLPEDTIVYCGHGTETTIKQEKLTNYILQY